MEYWTGLEDCHSFFVYANVVFRDWNMCCLRRKGAGGLLLLFLFVFASRNLFGDGKVAHDVVVTRYPADKVGVIGATHYTPPPLAPPFPYAVPT